jgi:hypothetical protein
MDVAVVLCKLLLAQLELGMMVMVVFMMLECASLQYTPIRCRQIHRHTAWRPSVSQKLALPWRVLGSSESYRYR